MAASARAITPSHTGPFKSNGFNPLGAPSSGSKLSPIPISSAIRSPSPRSPKSSMTPRISPQPMAQEERKSRKDATLKISQAITTVSKTITVPENGAPVTGQTSPTDKSVSSLSSVDPKSATTTAPAVAPPTTNAENASGTAGPEPGRAVVDAGLHGDATPNRSFTFPPPLDDLHTPSQRNLSLPNNVYSSGSPKTGSGSRKHKCPYCSTEFTRHHNLKSHLLTHSQEKPFECQQCQSRFRRLHDLKRHTKLHTGERPHTCPNCGRSFARGDALARHSKGPGGCAGRRPSFISEDPSGRGGDDSMDGIEYTAEPEHMDEDDNESLRGATDSAKKGSMRQDSYRPRTYPGPGPQHSHTGGFASTPRSRDPSISSQAPLPIQHFNATQQPVFQQAGMTESPKPISPRHTNDKTLAGASRTSQFSGSGRGTSPMSLPHPAGAPQLPALHNIAPLPASGAGSHPSSMSSSHPSGSGNSTREILGASGDVWVIIRDLENRLTASKNEHNALIAQLRSDHARADQEHRTQIAQLKEEVERLKAQLSERSRS